MELSDLSASERTRLDRVLREAESRSRIEFSLVTGVAQGVPRTRALLAHSRLVAPERSTLILVDVTHRALEIVTGASVRARVPDEKVVEIADEMCLLLTQGELFEALALGMNRMADAATA